MKTQKFSTLIIVFYICFANIQTYAQWRKVVNDTTPTSALVGGNENDGSPLYIARINHEGGVHIGKARKNAHQAFIPYGGQELIVDNYEVYISKGQWINVKNGKFPKGAYVAGYENDGSALYIARAFIDGGWHIGKARINATEAFIPYGGREEIISDFQIFVR